MLLLLVLLLFGPKKIPEIARMLGRGLNEVKKVQREINTEIHRYSSDIQKEALEMEKSIQSGITNNSRQNNSKSTHSDNYNQNQDDNLQGKQGSENTGNKNTGNEINAGVADNQDNENNMPPERPGNQTNDDNKNDLPYPYNQNE